MFARELMPDSNRGIVEPLMNLYVTPTLRLQDIWRGIERFRIHSNAIVRYRTLLYTEN